MKISRFLLLSPLSLLSPQEPPNISWSHLKMLTLGTPTWGYPCTECQVWQDKPEQPRMRILTKLLLFRGNLMLIQLPGGLTKTENSWNKKWNIFQQRLRCPCPSWSWPCGLRSLHRWLRSFRLVHWPPCSSCWTLSSPLLCQKNLFSGLLPLETKKNFAYWQGCYVQSFLLNTIKKQTQHKLLLFHNNDSAVNLVGQFQFKTFPKYIFEDRGQQKVKT